MLILFTDDYEEIVAAGMDKMAEIQLTIAAREPFIGNSPVFDNLYAISVAITAIIDHFTYDDNSDPASNEALLQCLKGLINTDICPCKCIEGVYPGLIEVTPPSEL